MLARIRFLAGLSVARGCGFAGLAILTLMVGLSWDVPLACKVGGLLSLLVCIVLLLKAACAPYRPVRKTELWMMLEPDQRPAAAVAQRVMSATLQTCYLRFALIAAGLSAALLSLSIALQLGAAPFQVQISSHQRLAAHWKVPVPTVTPGAQQRPVVTGAGVADT